MRGPARAQALAVVAAPSPVVERASPTTPVARSTPPKRCPAPNRSHPARVLLLAVGLAVAGGLIAGILGGWRVSRLAARRSLRRVE